MTKRVRITSELPPGAAIRDDGTIDWSAVKADEPTWIQHERPDGHRSLWIHVGRWFTIEPGSVGEIGRACVNVGPRGEVPTYASSIGLDWITARWGCPVPTPEDLAWLRGAT